MRLGIALAAAAAAAFLLHEAASATDTKSKPKADKQTSQRHDPVGTEGFERARKAKAPTKTHGGSLVDKPTFGQ